MISSNFLREQQISFSVFCFSNFLIAPYHDKFYQICLMKFLVFWKRNTRNVGNRYLFYKINVFTSCFYLCLNDVSSLKYFYILIQSFSYLSNVLMWQFLCYFNIQTKVRVNQLVVSTRLDEPRKLLTLKLYLTYYHRTIILIHHTITHYYRTNYNLQPLIIVVAIYISLFWFSFTYWVST